MLFLKWNQTHTGHKEIDSPYTRFLCTELILRDQLAIDRTVLANERTFLAYCRTCLTLILTGAGFIKFFNTLLAEVTGFVLIGLGILVIIIGSYRSSVTARNIRRAGAGMIRQRESVCGTGLNPVSEADNKTGGTDQPAPVSDIS